MRRVWLAFCFGLVAVSSYAACDLSIVSVRPCDSSGTPSAAAALGSPYLVRVDWNVSGTTNGQYAVRFEFANRQVSFTFNQATPGSYWAYADFGAMPLDGAIPVRVTLDPANVSGDTNTANNVGNITYRPAMPSLPVAYYAARNLRASQSFRVHVGATSIQTLQLILGAPYSDTSQSVVRVTPPAGSTLIQTTPMWQPIRWREIQNPTINTTHEMSQTFDIVARNVRVNEPKVNQTATWAAFAGQPVTVTRYLQPEATIESNDPLIGSFVSSTLGANYKATMTPMTAARKLFLKTVSTITYEFPSPAPTAKQALQLGRGDCGSFSSLYVAALRRAGIPARMVFGWREGTDVTHAWMEMFMPGVGWIPQDPTDSDGWDPTGTFAYGFGVVTDLNARAFVSKGSTLRLPNQQTMSGIQIGAWYYWNASGPVPTVKWTTGLVTR